ncbi:hypothetical protein DFJ58DRAFT_842820 [Suillus subalutaceus]|uniref:uncharacterized protein n=1 Tax=Suillus subalutaceus TaxID=48586 RepID=UPI001B8742BA|nr:uncharacterized protein DFJ58DRAFT_842820 [Suillus subalutaceus]KAG1848708.1 hypothetical protein DFJ58DRAFT_842820 [Suillus subalutaceus]
MTFPYFFADIDSPGEQRKYSVALIEHLFTLLPPQATVVTLYDVGCVLAWSLSKFEILPPEVVLRLCFATTAMHAYGHEWACQLVHNPRICIGLGLSDGSEMKADLGDWIRHCLNQGIKAQGSAALDIIDRYAPARLRKELNTVLALQADLDTSERALQTTRTMLEKETASNDTLYALESLQRGHNCLMTKVEALYSSLNVHDRFPELNGVSLNFVCVLLMTHDLKINIRKRAIASFFEWDKLDRAVGGSHQALGMKLHQHTRKAIAKHQPALMTAIQKFNSYYINAGCLGYTLNWREYLDGWKTQTSGTEFAPFLNVTGAGRSKNA